MTELSNRVGRFLRAHWRSVLVAVLLVGAVIVVWRGAVEIGDLLVGAVATVAGWLGIRRAIRGADQAAAVNAEAAERDRRADEIVRAGEAAADAALTPPRPTAADDLRRTLRGED